MNFHNLNTLDGVRSRRLGPDGVCRSQRNTPRSAKCRNVDTNDSPKLQAVRLGRERPTATWGASGTWCTKNHERECGIADATARNGKSPRTLRVRGHNRSTG